MQELRFREGRTRVPKLYLLSCEISPTTNKQEKDQKKQSKEKRGEPPHIISVLPCVISPTAK